MTLQETLQNLNWGGEGYGNYQGYAYMTGPETSAWNQLGYDSSVMNSWMMNQFKEMQGLLNQTIIPQLTQMATNPQGFGAQGLAAMRSQLISTVGGQYASQLRQQQQNFATQNLAGLGSGVEQAITAGLGQGAAGQEAGGLNQIAIANAQAQMQQQQFALQGLQGAVGQLGELPQSAQLAAGLTGLEQQTAHGFYGQQSPTSALLGSLAGTALTIGGGLIGGPTGAMIGGALGGGISGALGGSASGSLASNWGSLGLPSIWGSTPAAQAPTGIVAGTGVGYS